MMTPVPLALSGGGRKAVTDGRCTFDSLAKVLVAGWSGLTLSPGNMSFSSPVFPSDPGAPDDHSRYSLPPLPDGTSFAVGVSSWANASAGVTRIQTSIVRVNI